MFIFWSAYMFEDSYTLIFIVGTNYLQSRIKMESDVTWFWFRFISILDNCMKLYLIFPKVNLKLNEKHVLATRAWKSLGSANVAMQTTIS